MDKPLNRPEALSEQRSPNAINNRFSALANVLKLKPATLRIALIFAGIAVLAILIANLLPSKASDIPIATVQYGEFIIDLNETGRLRAEHSVTLSAPPIRTNLQIIWLIPEGTQVEKGDTLLQFDTTEIRQQVDDQLADIELARANLEKTLASMQSNMANHLASVENARASYRLAELRLEQMKFEADVRQEEGKLNLLQAELALKQAENEVRSQIEIDSAEVRSLELKIKQSEMDLEKTQRELEKLTLIAPAPGLVVYKEAWKGSEMSKIKVGDTPWRGQAVIELPDLSSMLVETTVNEVDVAKVAVGQEVEIQLDAYPGPIFKGEVIKVGVLAHSADENPEVKVFDVLVRIANSDPLLKPGMSARVRIIVDRLKDKRWIPIEAVFQADGQSFVWEKSGIGWKRKTLELGRRNADFVIVESELAPGTLVALADPNAEMDIKPPQKVNSSSHSNSSGESAAPTVARRGGRRMHG